MYATILMGCFSIFVLLFGFLFDKLNKDKLSCFIAFVIFGAFTSFFYLIEASDMLGKFNIQVPNTERIAEYDLLNFSEHQVTIKDEKNLVKTISILKEISVVTGDESQDKVFITIATFKTEKPWFQQAKQKEIPIKALIVK